MTTEQAIVHAAQEIESMKTLLSWAGGAIGTLSGIILYMLKRWATRMETSMDKMSEHIIEFVRHEAETKEKYTRFKGCLDSLRESTESLRESLGVLKSSQEGIWLILVQNKLAPERIPNIPPSGHG